MNDKFLIIWFKVVFVVFVNTRISENYQNAVGEGDVGFKTFFWKIVFKNPLYVDKLGSKKESHSVTLARLAHPGPPLFAKNCGAPLNLVKSCGAETFYLLQ